MKWSNDVSLFIRRREYIILILITLFFRLHIFINLKIVWSWYDRSERQKKNRFNFYYVIRTIPKLNLNCLILMERSLICYVTLSTPFQTKFILLVAINFKSWNFKNTLSVSNEFQTIVNSNFVVFNFKNSIFKLVKKNFNTSN